MPKPIRLLQIVDSLHAGGMENIMVQVLNRLDPARFQATVCCLTREGPFAERLPDRVQRVVLHKAPGFQRQTVGALRKVIRGGFDLIHTHHLGGLIYTAMARPLLRGPRIIHSEHIVLDGWELETRRLWQRRLLYHFAHCVFTVSGEQLQQLERCGLRRPGMFTLTNGVDCSRFQPPAVSKAALRQQLGLPAEGFWLGNVARFAPAKRHLDLISAFEKIAPQHPQARLLLVGDGGPEKERVLSRLNSSPVQSRMHWAGLQQNPTPWYQAMDTLVIASASEGLPNAALEGLACGLPLLANEACGVREVAQDKLHGWIGDFATVDRLAEALIQPLTTSPAALQALSDGNRQHVQTQFSIDSMMTKYDRLYQSVAEGRRVSL